MRKSVKYSIKMTVLATGLISCLGLATMAAADSLSNKTVTVQRDVYNLVNSPTTKSGATGSDAQIIFSTKVGANDTVNVVSVNSNGNVVSSSSASFHGTSANTSKAIPYEDGKGKQGNQFRPRFYLTQNSASSSVTVKYTYIP